MKKYVLSFIMGMLVMGGVAYAADLLFDAKSISYESEYTEKDNVADAIDELLSGKAGCAEGYICKKVNGKIYEIVKDRSHGKLAYDSTNNPFAKGAGCSTTNCFVDDKSQTSGVWEYDEDTMDANSDGGTLPIYYYRGVVSDNNVYFSGKCWKIIRTTSTGGTKLIYNGTNSGTEDAPVCNGTNPAISTSQKFGASASPYYYSFYTFNTSDFLGTGTSSSIKTYIEDTAYSLIGLDSTIEGTDKKWEDMLEDHPFCMDRRYNTSSSATTYTKYESKSSTMYYGPFIRVYSTHKPTLDCESEDQLTKANGKLAKKISLITADEVMLAGGTGNNYSYYLYTGSVQWTLSPRNGSSSYADVFYIQTTGAIEYSHANYSYSVRPVISLSNVTEVNGGDGTSLSPYVIKTIS